MDRPYLAGPSEPLSCLSRLHIPQDRGAIACAGKGGAPIGTEGHALYPVFVTGKTVNQLTTVQVPQAYGFAAGTGQTVSAIGREPERTHATSSSLEISQRP